MAKTKNRHAKSPMVFSNAAGTYSSKYNKQGQKITAGTADESHPDYGDLIKQVHGPPYEVSPDFLAAIQKMNLPQVDQALPEIKDPTNQRIWEIIQQDLSITDTELGQKMGNMGRQAVNVRRKFIEGLGYKVREPKPRKKKLSRQNR